MDYSGTGLEGQALLDRYNLAKNNPQNLVQFAQSLTEAQAVDLLFAVPQGQERQTLFQAIPPEITRDIKEIGQSIKTIDNRVDMRGGGRRRRMRMPGLEKEKETPSDSSEEPEQELDNSSSSWRRPRRMGGVTKESMPESIKSIRKQEFDQRMDTIKGSYSGMDIQPMPDDLETGMGLLKITDNQRATDRIDNLKKYAQMLKGDQGVALQDLAKQMGVSGVLQALPVTEDLNSVGSLMQEISTGIHNNDPSAGQKLAELQQMAQGLDKTAKQVALSGHGYLTIMESYHEHLRNGGSQDTFTGPNGEKVSPGKSGTLSLSDKSGKLLYKFGDTSGDHRQIGNMNQTMLKVLDGGYEKGPTNKKDTRTSALNDLYDQHTFVQDSMSSFGVMLGDMVYDRTVEIGGENGMKMPKLMEKAFTTKQKEYKKKMGKEPEKKPKRSDMSEPKSQEKEKRKFF